MKTSAEGARQGVKPTSPSYAMAPLDRSHAAAAAHLHRTCIATGFLSSLGEFFLRQLYAAVSACPSGFGMVCADGEGEVLGFIACATDTARLYRQALVRRGIPMALPLIRHLAHPSVLRRMWHSWRYPSVDRGQLPAAEILSIAISPDARGKGLGAALMTAAVDEFRRRGIHQVRVAVWSENAPANALYQRFAFALAQTRMHHGKAMNIYVLDVKG